MTHKEYNGWHNYETWLVNLWLTNDEGSYDYLQEVTAETSGEDRVYRLAERLKEEITESTTLSIYDSSLAGDLLGAALSEVNWYELAEHYVADYLEEQE